MAHKKYSLPAVHDAAADLPKPYIGERGNRGIVEIHRGAPHHGDRGIFSTPIRTRREALIRLLGLGLLYPLAACKDGDHKMGFFTKKEVVLDVVMFNYFDRPIFEVLLDGIEIGGAGAYGGGGGVIAGVSIPLGTQTLSWRLGGPRGMPRNGETVTVTNELILLATQISSDDCYLGVHIYPDNTAELTLSQYLPERTPKGEQIFKEKHIGGR